jgi:hypothetical protein
MANTLGSVSNGKVIAQRALELLVENYNWISSGVSDFSDATARKGDSITTHIVSIQSASDYSTTAGYVPADVTQTDVTVTLNQFKHTTYAVNDDERTSSNINLINRFAEQAAHALGKAMVDSVLGLVTTHYASTLTVAADATTFRSIVSAGLALDNNKVPVGGRFAVLSPGNYASLLNDANIVANAQRSGDVVASGQIGTVAGITVYGYNGLAAGVSKGFVAQREAMVVATRLPAIPDGVTLPGSVDVVTEPKSGLSLQVAEHYNFRLGSHERSYRILYGVGRGQTSSLVRIV